MGDDDGGQASACGRSRASGSATGAEEFGVQPQALRVLGKEDSVSVPGSVCLKRGMEAKMGLISSRE
jgi:hypothetical protein